MLGVQVEVLVLLPYARIGLIDKALDRISVFIGVHHRRITQLGALDIQFGQGLGLIEVDKIALIIARGQHLPDAGLVG